MYVQEQMYEKYSCNGKHTIKYEKIHICVDLVAKVVIAIWLQSLLKSKTTGEWW